MLTVFLGEGMKQLRRLKPPHFGVTVINTAWDKAANGPLAWQGA